MAAITLGGALTIIATTTSVVQPVISKEQFEQQIVQKLNKSGYEVSKTGFKTLASDLNIQLDDNKLNILWKDKNIDKFTFLITEINHALFERMINWSNVIEMVVCFIQAIA